MTGADRETGTVERVACGHDEPADTSVPSSREQASARTDALSLFRIYGEDELGADGYPFAWKQIPFQHPAVQEILKDYGLKDHVRLTAGHRCERCHHPYLNGTHGNGEWTPCDEGCSHGGPIRVWSEFGYAAPPSEVIEGAHDIAAEIDGGFNVDARWRILTVHHLNGVKADCRWWNLAALCQRCHLTVQGRVVMDRAFILEHSDWFKPHAAGFYADKYLGEQLTREQTLARLDELLGLERLA